MAQRTPASATSIGVEEISAILRPCLAHPLDPALAQKLLDYLDVLLRWNEKTNLTSIRSPREIIQRHFGESLFAAENLPPRTATLLDFGSGAGFPGLPIQLLRPDVKVTLAESQGKKAAFLREAARALELPIAIHSGRAEELPASALFSVVALRAVDKMSSAIPAAVARIAPGGTLLMLTSIARMASDQKLLDRLPVRRSLSIPNSEQRILLVASEQK